MTVTNGNGNGNGDSYVRPNFLSDAVRGREIDGSMFSSNLAGGMADDSSWIDEVRRTGNDLFRKSTSQSDLSRTLISSCKLSKYSWCIAHSQRRKAQP
jgi:hypothetical protein